MSKSSVSNICSVECCDNESCSKGMCSTHYQRLMRLGTTELARSPLNLVDRLDEMTEMITESGCAIWIGAHDKKSGYGRVNVDKKSEYVHRVVWERHYGKIPDGLFVCHTCDVSSCINVLHLFLGTPLDNMRDKINKGRHRHPVGSCVGSSKITESDVKEIRRRKLSGEAAIDIGKYFHIHASNVRKICLYEAWAHVKGDVNES